MAWALDLDGVVWRGDDPIPGSAQAVAHLQAQNIDVLYVTNSSSKTAVEYVAKLACAGIDAAEDQLVHSGFAAARMVSATERVLVCGGAGIVEGLRSMNVDYVVAEADVSPPPVDVVIIGYKPNFELQLLNQALSAIHNGARLVATNMDPLYPVPKGFQLGTGSLTAAVMNASGVEATFGGKPNAPIADLLQSLAERRGSALDVMVGDQPSTDGLLAERMGAKFALVHTGVTGHDHGPLDVAVAYEAHDLRAVVAAAEAP